MSNPAPANPPPVSPRAAAPPMAGTISGTTVSTNTSSGSSTAPQTARTGTTSVTPVSTTHLSFSTKTPHIASDVNELMRIGDLFHRPDLKAEIRGRINTFNAQATAAVFLGAIQSQLLKVDNTTLLKSATSTFFLVGILFNIIGAYFALTAASKLDSNLNKAQIEQEGWKHAAHKPDAHSMSKVARDLAGLHDNQGPKEAVDNEIPYEKICQSIRRFRLVGNIAYLTITLGFSTCPAALICLAFDQGPLVMQVVALVVVGILVFLGLACSVIYRTKTHAMF